MSDKVKYEEKAVYLLAIRNAELTAKLEKSEGDSAMFYRWYQDKKKELITVVEKVVELKKQIEESKQLKEDKDEGK